MENLLTGYLNLQSVETEDNKMCNCKDCLKKIIEKLVIEDVGYKNEQ